ncbi:TPA: hypothetical protein NKU96_001973 [Vibrio parahaemolyticus]|nr:hypothetical protein [Vibrio parahaemolyticus]HCH3912917.1 hypothetical protein [Vibrio parahaemolyticus]
MNTELKQAQELHAEAVEMLRQTRQMHDLTMSNQRSLVYALSCLLPKHMVTVKADFSDQPENTAQQIADNARCVLEAIEKREVYDIVHAINVLAMANTDILNINTKFRGCSNLFIVRVRPLSVASPDGDEYSLSPVVYRGEVSLVDGFYIGCPTGDCPIQRLLRIESEITELIIEAREEAEAKAEVEA